MLRRATPADSDAILHCLHTAFAPFRHFYSPEGYADTTLTPDTLAQRFTRMSIYVEEDAAGKIIGTHRLWSERSGVARPWSARSACPERAGTRRTPARDGRAA
jgi:hypothetical protein